MESGKIFVGGLSWDTDKDALQAYFVRFGEVTDCVVMKNPQTQKSRGFGFVTFRDSSVVEVVLAASEANGHSIDGRTVDAKPCSARGSGGNQGGRSGGGGGGRSSQGYQGRTTKIFVGGLPNDASDDSMKGVFSKFGQVTDVVIMYDQEKQRSRGFGFLTFDSEDAVEAAVKEHFVEFNGKKVECKRAEPRQVGVGGRGGRGGGRGGYQGWGGMGDGGHGGGWGNQSNMYGNYGSGGQQGGYGGGYNQGYDQSWGNQNYGSQQGYSGQNWGGQQQSYGGQNWGGNQGYSGQQGWQANGQGQSSYGAQSSQPGEETKVEQDRSMQNGSSGGGSYGGYGGGSSDSYNGGGYGGGKSSGGGGGGSSQGYHPYKR